MTTGIAHETFPNICAYLGDYNFALEQGRELPVMRDDRLTTSEQTRIGKFLLKADPRGVTARRHQRQLDAQSARSGEHNTPGAQPITQEGEQL